MLVLYSIFGGKEDSVYAPNVVYTSPSAPVSAGSGASFYNGSRRGGTLMYRHSAPATQTTAPVATMRSTSSASVARVYQTSNASVHSYGSGGGWSGVSRTYVHRNSNSSGINYTALAYSGAIYVPTHHNAVTAVGANRVEDVAAQKLGAPRRMRMDGGEGVYPDPPEDPAPDPEPPVPAGNIPWLMVALMAASYAVRVALRKKNDDLCTIVTK